ncbi:MAG TPA: helix-turn-helix domain-containing protein [Pseudonocardiaceae bacterium]
MSSRFLGHRTTSLTGQAGDVTVESWACISQATQSRTIDVHVRRLRATRPDRPLITTARQVGYVFDDTGDVSIEE